MPARQLREIRVDSVMFQCKKPEINDRLKTMTFAELQQLPQDHAFAKHLRTNSELASEMRAFRVISIPHDDRVFL